VAALADLNNSFHDTTISPEGRGDDLSQAFEGVAKFEEEWRLCVCPCLPSRDRKGAVDQPNIATPSSVSRATLRWIGGIR
jgi:hypothetical protein